MPSQTDVIRNHQAAVRKVRDRLDQVARAAWWSLPAYRDVDIDQLVEQIVPQVLAGERRIAQLTDAYLSGLALTSARGVDDAVVTGTATRGIPPEAIYRRPATTLYTELSKGKSYQGAVDAGLSRLLNLIATDMQLAQRLQERQSMEALGFEYCRRTLTGRENCGLCIIASTQRYRVKNLKAIHPGCDCGSAPVSAASDPGQVLNDELLEAMHDQIGFEFGEDDRGGRILHLPDGSTIGYRDVIVREHGELGPVLTLRGHRFTGPEQLAA